MQLATLQTLADPSRFQIVEALLEGEQAVNDLVSKMLRPEPFRELNAWVSQYRALWEGRLDAFAAALERKQQSRPRARRTRRRR